MGWEGLSFQNTHLLLRKPLEVLHGQGGEATAPTSLCGREQNSQKSELDPTHASLGRRLSLAQPCAPCAGHGSWSGAGQRVGVRWPLGLSSYPWQSLATTLLSAIQWPPVGGSVSWGGQAWDALGWPWGWGRMQDPGEGPG